MQKLALSLLIAISAPVAQAKSAVEGIDPELKLLSTSGDTRILVFQQCSAEHCWSETYIQAISVVDGIAKVSCSVKIKEIFVGHIVNDVSWSDNGIASIRVSSSHGGFEPHAVQIALVNGCDYTVLQDPVGS